MKNSNNRELSKKGDLAAYCVFQNRKNLLDVMVDRKMVKKKMTMTKLSYLAVLMILVSTMSVSVFAVDVDNNNLTNNASNRLAENKMSKMLPTDQEIKLQGTAVSGDVGDFVWWRVAVDDVVFGPLSCSDTIAVYCGGGGVIPDAYIDPDITPGDKVEVYGYYTCTGHEFDYVEPYRSDHYIKRIETCGKILDYVINDGTYHPGQIVRATMLYKSLMSTPADFKGVFKVRSPTGEIYSNSNKERTPAGREDSFGYYGDGDVLDRMIPEDASTGWYDAKLELWNADTNTLCDDTEWIENQFKIEEIQEIKFVGTAIEHQSIIGASHWTVDVDKVISGPQPCSDQLEVITWGSWNGAVWGYVDPTISEGDGVEVFGRYEVYDENQCHVILEGSDRYYINKSATKGSIKITSVSPPPGTTLNAGDTVTFTVNVDYDLGPSDHGKIRLSVNQYTTGVTDKEYSIGIFDPHSGSYTFTPHTETIGDDWENVYVTVKLYAAKQGKPLPKPYTDFDSKHYPIKGKGGGSLLHFDLDYKGTEPASGKGDGSDQHQIYAQPGQSFVMYMFYEEGNAGNQYIIRAYPEWDKNSFILNSDNDESTSELAQEMGGHRYDVGNYIIPSVPGEYKIKVVYSNSAAPPTWDNYNRLLGEFTVIVEGDGDCIETVPSDHWKGEYFNNKNLEGSPLMVRDDGTGYLNFDWDVSSPSTSCGIGTDFFSVRWTRTLNFDSGTWRFTATTDDGMRVYVDGSLVIDKWFNQVATTYIADVDLTAGTHTIKVEYYEYDLTAVAKLSWEKGGGKEIKFTGTATNYWVSGGQIHHWTVLVDEVIEGSQPCEDQVDITVYDSEVPSPWWGYVDPNLNSGDRVEVYGRYYDGHCSAIHLHGSTDYYIRASGSCATKTVTLHYPKEKGLSEVYDFETGDVFKWGDKPWSEFQIWTLGDNTICGECAHFVDMGTVDICSTEPPPYSTKTYDISRLNPKVGHTYGVALGCPVKESTQIHILAYDGNSVTFEYEEEELPDLTLSSDDISFSNPSPAVGEIVTITAIIHNIGTTSANDVIVQFFDGNPNNGGTQIGDDQTIASINAGGTGTAQVDWTATAGSHDIYVIVDPYDDIPELDENNNEAHINCKVEVLSGSLTVTVMNAAGKSLPDCGGTIEVQLYDKDLIPIETESQTYSGGESSVQLQFDNLANEQHFIEVYHIPNSDLKLKEYWGGDEVTVSDSTPKDFVRHTQVVYDVKINGESPYENEIVVNAGEPVHVDITVKNFEGESKNVEVRLILDQDKSSPYDDFDETQRGSIPQNGEDDFEFDCPLEEAGTYYFYIVVCGLYGEYYYFEVVDQHDWYKAVVPPGSLTVTVMNAANKPLPDCGGTIDVVLCDKDDNHIETESNFYSGGESSVQVQFDNLANEQQFINVFHTPNSDLKLGEFWGRDEVTVSGSTTKDFVRHTQVVYDVKINGESPYENEIEVNAGEQVHVDITVKNFEAGTSSKNVEVWLILDQDKSFPYDFDDTHGGSIPQNGERDFGFDCPLEEAGTYYFYIVVRGEYVSFKVVDQHDWYKAFVSSSQLPDLTFSYEDEYSSDGISIDPDVLEVGEPVKIKVAVQNVMPETTITDNFYVNFYLGDPDVNDDGVIDDNANVIGSYLVEEELPLPYGEVIYPWTTWTPTEVGTFDIYVVIDTEIDTTDLEIGSVVEFEEDNNEAHTEIDFEVEYWAVLVGGTTDHSTEDVIALKNVLESNFNFDENQNLKCLIEGEATKENIEKAINWMNDKADANDVCVFYFSGHGDSWSDHDPQDPACIKATDGCISDTKLEKWFNGFDTNNLLFIFSSCSSGGLISNLEGYGRAILTCSQDYHHDCCSFFSHGEFTFYIIQSLYGAADENNGNSISPDELFEFANSRMEGSNPAESIDSGFEFPINIKQNTLQDLINNAPSGSTIHIPPGTYNEHLFINKPLTLIGDDVTIDGEGLIGGALIYSDDVNIDGFKFQNCGYAIYLDSSNGCEISNNDLKPKTISDGCSVWLRSSNRNLITLNLIYDNHFGIYLLNSNGNEIKNNNIYNNDPYGICVRKSKNSIIRFNNIYDNKEAGLSLFDSRSNQIYHNNFYDNVVISPSESENQWDNGYPSGGNYWSYIGCQDLKHGEEQDITGGDGICDNAYPIPDTEKNSDNYPFKNENGWQIQIDGICNPIELILTDPDGLTLSKEENGIPDATYTELDIDGDGDFDDRIIIDDRKIGDYRITVIPEPDAKPTDTYTLEVTAGDTTTVLAENVAISEIPTEPYIFKSEKVVTYDHDGDGFVEDDLDDLTMATDAYLGFNTGSEYDHDGDGIVEDDLDDLTMATDAYLGFITSGGEER